MAPIKSLHPLHRFDRLEAVTFGRQEWLIKQQRGHTPHLQKTNGLPVTEQCQSAKGSRCGWSSWIHFPLSIGQSCFLRKSMLIQRIPRQRIQTQNLHMVLHNARCQVQHQSNHQMVVFHKQQVKDLMWKNKLQIVCRINFVPLVGCWPFGTTP